MQEPGCGGAAIAQAFFLAQALHQVFINGSVVGTGRHGISCRQSKRARERTLRADIKTVTDGRYGEYLFTGRSDYEF